MSDYKDDIKQTKANATELMVTLNNLYEKLAELKQQQSQLTNSGKANTEYFKSLTSTISIYQSKVDATTESLSKTNIKMLDQLKVLVSSQGTVKTWGNAYEGAQAKVDKLSQVLSSSANGFKPLADNMKTAAEAIEPLKKGISVANQAFTTFKENQASGKSVSESLKAAFTGATGGLKGFKIALAETGIGLIIIAVAALIEKLQNFKPLMDQVNAVAAATGAIMSSLGNFILNPAGGFKELGSSMVSAAKDAYTLSLAQDKLKTAISAQEVANESINTQIDLLKEQASNTKLSIAERRKALKEAQGMDEKNFAVNKKFADQTRINAIEDARIKGELHANELAALKERGTQYAQELLRTGKIDQEQFDAIKQADLDLIKLRKEHTDSTKDFLEKTSAIDEEVNEKKKKREEAAAKAAAERAQRLKEERIDVAKFIKETNEEIINSESRKAKDLLTGYSLEVTNTYEYYTNLLKPYNKFITDYKNLSKNDPRYAQAHRQQYEVAQKAITQLTEEQNSKLSNITKKFQDDDLKKLNEYYKTLNKIGLTARQQAQSQLDEEYNTKKATTEKIKQTNDELMLEAKLKLIELEKQTLTAASEKQISKLQQQQAEAQKIFNDASSILDQLKTNYDKDKKGLENGFDEQGKQDAENKTEDKLKNEIDTARDGGHESTALKKEIELLNQQHDYKINHEKHTQDELLKINEDYAKKKADLENKLTTSRIHAGDKFIDAALKNTKKDTAIYKAAFVAKKAIAIADVVMSTKKSIIASFEGYAHLPFIGQALAIAQGAFIATQGAMSIAEIAKQKPGFARGGQYVSDGRGALLPGYSRTDNTNAYLRSGEAVVVSEAMRNPWARNLVSAINVAHGGRDFSMANPGRGYAIGGVFTDGGNASRYYSQPMNDQKELANTLAYQMLNNFPPIYVDVKDVNNQQNILAQTVNRVNL